MLNENWNSAYLVKIEGFCNSREKFGFGDIYIYTSRAGYVFFGYLKVALLRESCH